MCGISGIELAIIIAAAVIILGPEKLPELLRMLAKVAHQARGLTGDLQKVSRAMDRDLPRRELERLVREQVTPAKDGGVGARTPSPRKKSRDAEVEARIDEIRRGRTSPSVGEAPAPEGNPPGIAGTADAETGGGVVDPGVAGQSEAPPALPQPRPATGAVAREPFGPAIASTAGPRVEGGEDAT